MKILVIDDSDVDRKVIIKMIRDAQIDNEILEAYDGNEAIDVIGRRHKEIALILCDWKMPGLTGLDVVEGVSKVAQLSHIPLYMVTSEDSEEKMAEVKDKCPNLAGYITKPFTKEHVKLYVEPYVKTEEEEASAEEGGEEKPQ